MDIVEQCRKAKEYNLFDADVYEQAANEIERLRDELDTWMSVFPDIAPESVLPNRSNLEKEIGRLRNELQRIADVSERWKDNLVSQINEMAHEALGDKKQ
jgi:ElaB/YqjD/DUF883 family membrane-anchored ribosome-binding protein